MVPEDYDLFLDVNNFQGNSQDAQKSLPKGCSPAFCKILYIRISNTHLIHPSH